MSSHLKEPLSGGTGAERLASHELEDLPTPLHQRKFSDVMFCLLFVLFWCGMLFLAGAAFTSTGGVNGYERLTNGVQYDGAICGVDDAVLKKDYLYWPNPASSPDFGICVAQCPSKNGGKVTPARVCTAVTGVSSDACWSTYDTTAVYHYCMPSNGSGNETAVKEIVSSGAFGRMVADLGKAWPVLIAAAVIAVVCGFIYLSMLWYLGPCLIYSTIIALVVGMGFGGYFLVEHSKRVAAGTQADALTAAGIVVWVCDVIFILVVCFMRKSLKVALTCLKQATLAINDMKRILFLPVVKFGILLLVMVWFTLVSVFIVSAGKFTSGSVHVPGFDFNVPFKSVEWTDRLRYGLLYHTFGTVWTLAFVMATADVIIAGAVAHWYFTPPTNGERNVVSPVSKSVAIAIKKQSGAIAFGSLVLTIVVMIKWAIRYIHKKLNNAGEGGKLLKFFVCCCMCCVSCFECCLKFMERQAYIEMAVFGGGFCGSAKRAYHLIARNALRLVAVNFLGSIFSILGVVLVVVATCVSSYFITVSAYSGPHGVSSPILIVTLAFLIAFVIGSVFMQVLDMSIQTMLHCFVADAEAHNGRPIYISHSADFARAVLKPERAQD